MSINFVSSKDSDEVRNMHIKSNNVEIMVGSETNEIIVQLLQRYQEGLEEKLKRSEFIFDSVNFLYYHLQKHKSKKNRIITYRFFRMVRNKKGIINSKNNDDNCFQYAFIVA